MSEEEKEQEVEIREESKNISIDNITREDVDSDEELWFCWYLQELKAAEIILDADVNRKPILLSNKVEHTYSLVRKKDLKRKTEFLMHPHEYTPDFNIQFNMRYRDVFYSLFVIGRKLPGQNIPFLSFSPGHHAAIVEVKPVFDMNNMTRLVRTNLKWVFDKYGMYIELIKVPDIFKDTFTPQKYIDLMQYQIKSKEGKSKIKWNIKTIDQYKHELDVMKVKMDATFGQKPIVDIE